MSNVGDLSAIVFWQAGTEKIFFVRLYTHNSARGGEVNEILNPVSTAIYAETTKGEGK